MEKIKQNNLLKLLITFRKNQEISKNHRIRLVDTFYEEQQKIIEAIEDISLEAVFEVNIF